MTPIFQACLSHVLVQEGGYVEHHLDKGGPTKYGITMKTLAAYRRIIHGVGVVGPEDVKALSVEEASKIYELLFWQEASLQRIKDQKLAMILFDQVVHAGPMTPIKMLQQVLNENFGEHLIVDGVLGNATEVAIATAHPGRLYRKLIQKAQLRYVEICVFKPDQLGFLKGWMNRTFALQTAIGA